jgi:hypothetical protein
VYEAACLRGPLQAAEGPQQRRDIRPSGRPKLSTGTVVRPEGPYVVASVRSPGAVPYVHRFGRRGGVGLGGEPSWSTAKGRQPVRPRNAPAAPDRRRLSGTGGKPRRRRPAARVSGRDQRRLRRAAPSSTEPRRRGGPARRPAGRAHVPAFTSTWFSSSDINLPRSPSSLTSLTACSAAGPRAKLSV